MKDTASLCIFPVSELSSSASRFYWQYWSAPHLQYVSLVSTVLGRLEDDDLRGQTAEMTADATATLKWKTRTKRKTHRDMENCDGVDVCRTNLNHNTLVELGVLEEANSLEDEHARNKDGFSGGPVTIRVNSRSGMPIRLGTRNVCVRQIINGKVENKYISKTAIREMTVEELESGLSDEVFSRCIKVSRIGMFWNRLKLILNVEGKNGEHCEMDEHM